MKKFIITIIIALMLCIPFTGVYAIELFSDNFDAENWDTTKKSEWTIDIRGNDETDGAKTLSGIAEAPSDFGNMFQVKGIVVGSQAKYNNAILQPNLGTIKKDVLKITYDVQPHTLVNKTMHAFEIHNGSAVVSILDFYRQSSSDYRIRLGASSTVMASGIERKDWYSVCVTIDLTKEKELSVEVYPRGSEMALVTYNGTLAETLGEAWATTYKSDGANAIRWRVNATKVDAGANVTIAYDNIKIEAAPSAENLVVTGEAVAGNALGASATLDNVNATSVVKWYEKGTDGAEDILVFPGEEYETTSSDIGKQIYPVLTPTDSSGLYGKSLVGECMEIAPCKVHTNTNICEQKIEFALNVNPSTFTTSSITLQQGENTPFNPNNVSVGEDKKTVTLAFEEGALAYNTEYTISISGAAFENTDLCTGTVSFTTRLAPGIVLTKISGNTEGKISFMSEIKLSTNENAEALYEDMNVYAQLIRDGNVIKTHSFVIDIVKGNEYVLKTAFFNPQESDTIEWKSADNLSNTLTLICEEDE